MATNSENTGGRGATALALAYAAVMALAGLLIWCAPLEVLLDRFVPDDAFYYFQPARNFAVTGFSSFDGLHFTNGYQPLWFLLCVPVFWLFPGGGETPLRVLLLIQVLLSAGATGLLVRAVARRFGLVATAVAFALWVFVMQRVMVDGLETGLLMFCYGLVFDRYAEWCTDRSSPPDRQRLLWLGLLAALTFLARTDCGFLVVGLVAALGLRPSGPWRARVGRLAWFALPVALLCGAYLLLNLVQTGHLTPVSGAAKAYHSQLGRDAAIQEVGSAAQVYWDNLCWAFRGPQHRHIAVGLVLPWLILPASRLRPLKAALEPLRDWWPFYFGALAAYLFYAVVFWGSFSPTPWYYGPHTFLTCLLLAGIGSGIDRLSLTGRVPGVATLILLALIIGPIVPAATALAAAIMLLVSCGLARVVRHQRPKPALAVAALLPAVSGICWANYGVSVPAWLGATFWTLIALAVALAWRPDPAIRAYGAAIVALSTLIPHGAYLVSEVTRPPYHWNYNLYRGALWARESLPVDATIWSGSAGILGYFSGRITVNTDGLANSYDFLENVLKAGRLAEYEKQWDYAIDAFPDEALTRYFPAGRFVPLPEELQRLGFPDGTGFRKLRVFQMNAGGQAGWPPEPAFEIGAPEPSTLRVGQKVEIRWTASNIPPGSTISLCYDADQTWDDGNEHWITVDGIRPTGRAGQYLWDTRGVEPGRYYIGGYLHDGRDRWVLARSPTPITLLP